MFRFIHTADWQLGKPFARIEGDIGALLRQERFECVARIASLAVKHEAGAVLVAGDVFDTPFPDQKTLHSAIRAMRGFTGPWVLLPGNHDPVQASDLWERLAGIGGGLDLKIAGKAEPIELNDGAVCVLPAPLLQRHGFEDASAWMDKAETTSSAIRIGLAHGSVREFGESEASPNLIAADRARRAGLDYLALGDWHGLTRIDARTWYSGTPEPDGFPANQPGHALLVEIEGSGREPVIETLDTAGFRWSRLVTGGESGHAGIVARIERLISEQARPDRLVLSVVLEGSIDLAGRASLFERIKDWKARLAYLRIDDRLRDQPSDEDLKALTRGGGVVGAVARRLSERSGEPEADLALRHLFAAMAADGT